MDIKKKYNEFSEKLTNVSNNINDEVALNKALDELIYCTKSTSFERYLEGWVCEKTELIDNTLYFLELGEIEKAAYISWMLNTYYKGTTELMYKDMLKDENYELCAKFIKIKDRNEIVIF